MATRGTLSDSFQDFEGLGRHGIAPSFMYFSAMFNALSRDAKRCFVACDDVREAIRLTESAAKEVPVELYFDQDFWRRALLRSFLSEVEGLLFVMRRIILWAHDRGELPLSVGEACMLREQDFAFDARKRKVIERHRFNRLQDNFILTFSIFPKVFGSTFVVDYGGVGWDCFQRAVDARNSITHPKSIGDVLLAGSIYNATADAISWFHESLSNILATADKEMIESNRATLFQEPRFQEEFERYLSGGPSNTGPQADV